MPSLRMRDGEKTGIDGLKVELENAEISAKGKELKLAENG